MSSAKMPQISYVFEESEVTIKLTDWVKRIIDTPHAYGKCYIRRFTHAKNLASIVLHEYLNVIVEDEESNMWTRLIVERSNPNDQVIAGKWGASEGYKDSLPGEHSFYALSDWSSSSSSSSSKTHVV
ncbi:hypothetical protein PG993_003228 [Apiospora rasikravindrae]|uniref:Uncharacterized protein n=1 Tax=Apiospora rasikravindrae TaxID=990691 RepID=A0ABR1U1K6_9PEZI